jgi:hypothetical protein
MSRSNEDEDDLSRQEVRELTTLLRSDVSWADLRAALRTQGLESSDVLLVSFMEDEVENEYGVVIQVKNRRVFEFERSTARGRGPGFAIWRERIPDEDTYSEYPQVRHALRMLDDRAIE